MDAFDETRGGETASLPRSPTRSRDYPSFDPRFEAHLCVTVKRRRQPGMRRLGHGMMGYSAVSESRLGKRSKGG